MATEFQILDYFRFGQLQSTEPGDWLQDEQRWQRGLRFTMPLDYRCTFAFS